MKTLTDTKEVNILPLLQKIDKIGLEFEISCLKSDIKHERILLNYYKELVQTMMRNELDNCLF